jgi:two-component system nitrogen regulation sensor histidine kinase NtrY
MLDESSAEPMADLARRFNALCALLGEKQHFAEQSEQLLHTLIDAAPMAILLLEDAGDIEYANETARSLFFEGQQLERVNFLSLLGNAPAPLREAVLGAQDRLFTVQSEGTTETYYLAKRHFELDTRTHTLLMVKHLTRELRRQEVDIWKKLIRVVSHELNNSLAPISSLAHSARVMVGSEQLDKLDRVFATIEDRAHHLLQFVEGYARFARLPNPVRQPVKVAEFCRHAQQLAPYATVTPTTPDATAYFDRAQLEQVALNLLKNAREAGGPEEAITLELRVAEDGSATLVVADRGPGMSADVLENAMLPFYSTKEAGSGLGLALCREIVEAHGGSIRIENLGGGGLSVSCWLPGVKRAEMSAKSKLTLSRL